MPGLDPGIHADEPDLSDVRMDCRVKPSNNEACSRAVFSPRGMVIRMPSKRGRRGTPGSNGPAGPRRLAAPRIAENFRECRGIPGAPRAVFNRLAPHEPRWTYRVPLPGTHALSTAGGTHHRHLRVWDTRAPDPGPLVTRGRRAGHRRLGPPPPRPRRRDDGHRSRSARGYAWPRAPFAWIETGEVWGRRGG